MFINCHLKNYFRITMYVSQSLCKWPSLHRSRVIFCLLFCRKRISFTKSINGYHVQTSLSLTTDGMHRHRNQTQWNWSVSLVKDTLHKTEHFKQSPFMSPSKSSPSRLNNLSVAIWQPTL